MYHGRLFPTSQMKKEALETSPSVPPQERKLWRLLPAFPGEKGSLGDISRHFPARKEALETSPNVPQRERKPWRYPPAFPRKKGSVGDIPQCSPARRRA